MLLKKGLLSDEDIKKEIGRNIFIHPFKERHIRGASINLSVSKLAWIREDKEVKSAYDSNKELIIIPANSTALIETNEIIHVSNIIGGTFHSKVALVAKGLGHIGTTLDPGWIGNCLITIHNHSNSVIKLAVGDTFISLKLFYVNTPSKFVNNNIHGRPELLGKNLTNVEKTFFDEDIRTNIISLKEVFHKSASYQAFQKKRESKLYKAIMYISGIILMFLIVGFLIYAKKNSGINSFTLVTAILSVISGAYFTYLINRISYRI